MQQIRILLLTPIWGRPEIVRLQMENVVRLTVANPDKFRITPLYVVSEQWAANLCAKLGFEYFFHPNLPLGRKLNAAIKSVLSENYDWIITNGSDNFCEPEILNEYLPYFSEYPAFGLNVVHAVEESTGLQKKMEIGYAFGAMRCVKWSLIQQMQGNFWNDHDNRALDYYSMLNLKEKTGNDIQVVYIETKLWDVKNGCNINVFSKVGGQIVEETLPFELKHLQV